MYVVGVTSPEARVIVLVSLRAKSYAVFLAFATTPNAVPVAFCIAVNAYLEEGDFTDSLGILK